MQNFIPLFLYVKLMKLETNVGYENSYNGFLSFATDAVTVQTYYVQWEIFYLLRLYQSEWALLELCGEITT